MSMDLEQAYRLLHERAEARRRGEICTSQVYWWEGEYEGTCGLPVGHDGPHFDGLSSWDDEGEPVDLD